MKTTPFLIATLAASAVQGQEFLDHLDDALTVSGFNDTARARVSGLLDVEGYYFQQPPPGLILANRDFLFNPRLTLFLDGQLGPKVYFFVQGRIDRGFDPADANIEARADEYAVRFTPWDDGRFNLQAGKFATVVGTWTQRHLSWDNPFVTAPLAYENPTPIYDSEAPDSLRDFSKGMVEAKYEYTPVIWGPSYATGAAASGRAGHFEYAAEIKNASLSSRPEAWDGTENGFDDPTFSGRAGWRPNPAWNFGVSASDGPYLRPVAASTLPPGHGIEDYHETVFGQDAGFAWHHLQIWAEVFESRFEVPRVGDADSLGYYVEAKYKFAPQWHGALRWNQQLFADVQNGLGGHTAWGRNIWRADAALGCRFTTHTQVKVQYSVLHENGAERDFSHLVAAQFTLKF